MKKRLMAFFMVLVICLLVSLGCSEQENIYLESSDVLGSESDLSQQFSNTNDSYSEDNYNQSSFSENINSGNTSDSSLSSNDSNSYIESSKDTEVSQNYPDESSYDYGQDNSSEDTQITSNSEHSDVLSKEESDTVSKDNNYPDDNYIYPFIDDIEYDQNETNIYENIYAKVDLNHCRYGYINVTYKDKWADSIEISLEVINAHSGNYEKTYRYNYSKSQYTVGKAFSIDLPVNDAEYCIVISSCIKGKDTLKMVIYIDRITVDGAITYEDICPSDDIVNVKETSSGIYSNKYVVIDTNTASKGYININYVEPNADKICVYVKSNVKNQLGNNATWNYTGNSKGKCNIKVALTYGDCEYTIEVSSRMTNNQTHTSLITTKAKLTIKLNNVSVVGANKISAGEVIYSSNMMFIKKANEIASTCSNDFEKVAKIYDWLTSYLDYGTSEITALGVYRCNLDKIYEQKKGVCYDFAVILAAMLRSQGISCKAVFGFYSNGQGHVWNEVYIPQSGSISTNKLSISGNKWCRLDPTYSIDHFGESAIQFMQNSSNYIWECYY